MNRIIPAGCLAALFLAGCNSPSQHTPVPRNYGAASDVAVIPVLRDNFNVPEFMLKRFLKMPEGPAPDGSGVPVLGVFRVKSGTLARILKFTVGPLELWALNSSPKDSALRKTLTNKLGSVRARKILAENFPRGSATSLIEHRAGQHNSDNVIEELASELIRKQGYNL